MLDTQEKLKRLYKDVQADPSLKKYISALEDRLIQQGKKVKKSNQIWEFNLKRRELDSKINYKKTKIENLKFSRKNGQIMMQN